jgi:23S rRNA pseudoU1915 N3-methylase RlmH
MSSLQPGEISFLTELFDMNGGYVLGFNNSDFGNFFGQYFNIDIHGEKYTTYGTSKAKKLRRFWSVESDELVGRSIELLVDHIKGYGTSHLTEDEKIQRKQDLAKGSMIAQRLCLSHPSITTLNIHANNFDSQYLAQQIRRMNDAVNGDPALAIGTAKELLETCCKTILEERNVTIESNWDIPALTKQTAKVLKLLPDDIPDKARGKDTIKRLLSNLGTIGQCLAELRNIYGTGHGKAGNSKGLSPRHAKLAVGAVATLATFFFETHMEKP